MTDAKRLVIDIETSPNLAYVWGLWDQNIGLNQIELSGEMISFAAKWYGKKEAFFYSKFHDGQEKMVEEAYNLINEADAVIHYNGKKFDMPHLRREFIVNNYSPHSPVLEIDLLSVARSRFRFASNKLDYVANYLGLGAKVKNSGFDLWSRCLKDDPAAWEEMKKYNIGDVRLTEKLYDKLRPWIKNHPHPGLFSGMADVCTNCESDKLERRGFSYTNTAVFQRFCCKDCGHWSRSAKSVERVNTRSVD